MNGFKTVEIKDLQFNPFTLIDKEWMLITAGNEQKCNTMTASWGGLGELWKHYVSFIFVRPQRYTLEFIEKEDYYSLCFFDESYRKALSFCGSHSGRDYDKCKETGLTPVFDEAAPYFAEAKIVLICRIYRSVHRRNLLSGKGLPRNVCGQHRKGPCQRIIL